MRALSDLDQVIGRGRVAAPRRRADTLSAATRALAEALEVLGELELLANTQVLDLHGGIDFYEEIARFEISLIKQALYNCGGKQTLAAAALGLKITTLNTKIMKYKKRLPEDCFAGRPLRQTRRLTE